MANAFVDVIIHQETVLPVRAEALPAAKEEAS